MSGEADERCDRAFEADVVIVGAGVAGLTVALSLPSELRVHLLVASRPGAGGATPMAQGGLAAAVGADDSPELHAADTVRAGAGLGDAALAELVAREAPAVVERLQALGVRFDRDSGGGPALGREGAHGRSRILHAGGDATGAELSRVLAAAAGRRAGLRISPGVRARDLALRDGEVAGVLATDRAGGWRLHAAPGVVLATGGAAALFLHTTNPPAALGDGIAIAARAGALLADLEFVQFHPTALAAAGDPMPLLTEALRGEGAVLVDGRGRSLLEGVHPAGDLAPRDVVARVIWAVERQGRRAFLDATRSPGVDLARRFPTVFDICRRAGLDPRHQPIPVSPAAHSTLGGIAVDSRGRSSLPGLWAVGEVAASGLHGANRLASNSLLEGVVLGARAAADVAARLREGAAAPQVDLRRVALPLPRPGLGTPDSAARGEALLREIRTLLWSHAGVIRDGEGLAVAAQRLAQLRRGAGSPDRELVDPLLVASLVVAAASARRDSRGVHYREDFPVPDEAFARRLLFRVDPRTGEPRPAGERAVGRTAVGVEVA